MKSLLNKSNLNISKQDVNQKKVLIIDLNQQSYGIKTFYDLNNYIGGVALGLKLYKMYSDKNPVVFSIGPLNGIFPFVSKTCVILENQGNLEDIYIGGTLSSRIKFLGIDSIVIYGISEEEVILDIKDETVLFKNKDTDIEDLGLPAKKTTLTINKNQLLVDNYFTTKEDTLAKLLLSFNLKAMVITGTKSVNIKNFEKYKSIYHTILNKKSEITVKSYTNLSCSGCPMGCRKSKEGEIGGNILIHSLVACEFSENIYSDIGIVFSCLNVLGYKYTHEDIENLPKLVEEILK